MSDVDDPDHQRATQPDSNLFRSKQRADDVQAWAQRMKDKRAARAAEGQPQQQATYWSSDALFEQSRQVADEERLSARTVQDRTELLASFGLGPAATSQEITLAFRQLAKLHHPDRYVHESSEIQAHHAEAMTKINTVYQALKTADPLL